MSILQSILLLIALTAIAVFLIAKLLELTGAPSDAVNAFTQIITLCVAAVLFFIMYGMGYF